MTVACILTPRGRGAVSSVAVRGPAAANYLDRFLISPTGCRAAEMLPGDVRFASWQARGSPEDVVFARTDDVTWEVHCHGGTAAVQRIAADLVDCGTRLVEWREWFTHSTSDALEAEALAALPFARTPRAAAVLLDQHRGALRTALQQCLDQLSHENDDQAQAGLEQLLATVRLGSHLSDAWHVALVGPPNVGKSSLLNRIVGYDRAIVYDQPGTTRDVVRAATAVAGWPFEFSDTAGLRDTEDHLEAMGIGLARGQAAEADLVLLVSDVLDESLVERWLGDSAFASHRVLRVLSKADRMTGCCPMTGDWLLTSAWTGAGLEDLLEAIVGRLLPAPPRAGQAVLFTPRQQTAVQQAAEALKTGNRHEAARQLTSLLGPAPE